MNTKTAEQAYTDARERIDSLRTRLDEVLAAHQQKQREWRGDWGLVGDINHLATLLQEAVEFMGGDA